MVATLTVSTAPLRSNEVAIVAIPETERLVVVRNPIVETPLTLILVDCKFTTVETPEELILPIRFPIKPNAVTIPLILAPMAVKIPIGDINCPLVLAMDFYLMVCYIAMVFRVPPFSTNSRYLVPSGEVKITP